MTKLGRILMAAALPFGGGVAAAKPERPVPAIERVLIISIDGLRPDRLLLADTPVLHRLIREGSYSFWAQTTAYAITLPSHVSMLTGVNPRKHKIEWNVDLPLKEPVYPAYPTVFEMARRAGYRTALVAGKSKFEPLARPGTLDAVRMPAQDEKDDAHVAAEAARVIRELRPDLLFVHFPAVDLSGHDFGWGSAEQLGRIARADAHVGELLAALRAAGLADATLVLVTSDHGGQGRTHDAYDPRSRFIPWIAHGPGVRPGYDLTQQEELQIRTEDTCATVCHVLGLSLLPYFDGKPVLAAFGPAPAP
ncbi:MAG: alkaline phosphatase family protein [Opitutaceae bacterium]|nr:alkaline phosphatase family protein [Opitutaceae bacterium]